MKRQQCFIILAWQCYIYDDQNTTDCGTTLSTAVHTAAAAAAAQHAALYYPNLTSK